MRPRPVRAALGRAVGPVAVVAALLAGLVLPALVLAPPASAHDELAGSSPAAGATLNAAPSEVTLSFEEAPLPAGLAVVVTGPDQASVTAGPPSVSGTDVVTPLAALSRAGTYTVAWRVVAADGHPVTGTFTFELAGESGSPSTTATRTTATGVTTAAPEPSASGSELLTVANSPGVDLTPWMVGGSALLLGVILIVGTLGVLARRRSS